MMASTEMGQQFGGFLEGALEVADETVSRLLATRLPREKRMSVLPPGNSTDPKNPL